MLPCCQQKPQPFKQFCLCWTEALQTVSKQIISLPHHLSCSGQGHLDAKALCPGKLALMSSYDTLMQTHLKAASRQERPEVSQMSHTQTRSHSPEDLPGCRSVHPLTAYPAHCTYCNDHIYWSGCIYYTHFPLFLTVSSAVGLGVPSFIYLSKHMSFVQQPRMQKAPPMPWHCHPAISSCLFWAVCSLMQPCWYSGSPHQTRGPPHARIASRSRVALRSAAWASPPAPLLAAPLSQLAYLHCSTPEAVSCCPPPPPQKKNVINSYSRYGMQAW